MSEWKKPVGSYGKQRRQIEIALAKHDYHPYEEMIKVAKRLKWVLTAAVEREDLQGVHDTCVSLIKANDVLCSYYFPRIKSVEITSRDDDDIVQMTPEQQIAALAQIAKQFGYEFTRVGNDGNSGLLAAPSNLNVPTADKA